jgi:hypothetical protein
MAEFYLVAIYFGFQKTYHIDIKCAVEESSSFEMNVRYKIYTKFLPSVLKFEDYIFIMSIDNCTNYKLCSLWLPVFVIYGFAGCNQRYRWQSIQIR